MEHQDPPNKTHPGKGSTTSKGGDQDTKKSKQGPRIRVSQACDRCRSRKDKCDGKKPACSTCTTHGRTCSYDTNVKKRGLPEGYVRGLEKLWGLAIREVRGVEDSILFVIAGEDGNDNESFLNAWSDESNSENLVEAWRKSQISRELERLLSNPGPTAEGGKRRRTYSDPRAGKRPRFPSTHADGTDNGAELSGGMWLDRKPDVRPQEDSPASPNPSGIYDNNNHFLGREDSILSPNYQHPSLNKLPTPTIDIPDLPSEAWHLLDVYFSYTHSWFPIIEKHDLLRTSYQYAQNRNAISLSGTGSGNHAALWAAIAYAKYQHRAINNIPRAQGPVAEMVWTAERMYSHARNLIPDEEGFFELGHVQALLILTLTNMGAGHLRRAWLLVGQAVRVAIDLGLDRPSDDILVALRPTSRAKHVFLGCFVLDTIIASRLGHRPHLLSEDIERVGLVEEDGLEQWDPWTDCLGVRRGSSASRGPASILSTFNRFVEVMQILNDVACISGCPRRAQSSTGLLTKLLTWGQSHSSSLHLGSASLKSEKAMSLLPHDYNLHIAYFNTLATLQLLSHGQGRGSANLEPSTESARQIVELLVQHSIYFGLLIVPPTFETFIKTAYDVVREVHSSIENTHITLNDWKRNLDSCLDTIEPAWPIFEAFKSSASYQAPSGGRRESQVAFELISGMNHSAETPVTAPTPNSLGTSPSPRVFRPQPGAPMNIAPQQPRVLASPAARRAQSFGQSSAPPFTMKKHPSPRSPFNTSNPMAAETRPIDTQASRIKNSTNLAQTQPANARHPVSMTSEMEVDPMFQEFATLDAMEW